MSLQTDDDAKKLIAQIGAAARAASRQLARLAPATKNAALAAMADAIEREAATILSENARDVEVAEKSSSTPAFVDRLRLDEKRLHAMANAIREIAAMQDPVGEVTGMSTRPNGLRIGRMCAPIGVVGMIYEARPNVTTDAAALCLKSGNAVILRGGSDAIHSNLALAKVITTAAEAAGIPHGAIQVVPTVSRDAVGEMVTAKEFIDVIIPRGGKTLIERIAQESTIPVLKHLDGNCHVYVDESANFDEAERIVLNAKTQRPGVCNAAESLVVHAAIAEEFVPRICRALAAAGVEIRGCERTHRLHPNANRAKETDWYAEYLDLIISVCVVDSFERAIEHINQYSSHHTEAILTRDYARAMEFIRAIDSACVHVNCSTRFSDGGEYGLGAEIGISTDKLHARGPVGLRELTTEKWIVLGEGHIRE